MVREKGEIQCAICIGTVEFGLPEEREKVDGEGNPIHPITDEALKIEFQLWVMTKCNHCFHKECLDAWYKQKETMTASCPVCKQQFLI